jgi:ATP-dependent phosphofructokinase / diphosphate-dependent phosphofructokinase
MAQQFDKIGVFVAGGPAPGINGVIKGIVQEADNSALRVLGFLDGADGLVHGRFVHLTRRMVEDIHIQGGSILGTSRYKMDAEGRDLARILDHLRREGVDGLISIGGEGTLQLADHLRRAGVRIVHVPKTIDNDIAGVAQTFGFDTAVHEASRMLTAVKLDAESSDLWFVVEIMGRYTGHLALEAGLAAGCTRVLIPEEGLVNIDELACMIDTRCRCGQPWGVILIAESAHFGEGCITRYGRLGGVSEALAERLEGVCGERKIPVRIRTSNLGYFLRCAIPTGFDRSYAAKLGLGAAQFIVDPARSGQMVSVVDDHLEAVPMEEVAGKVKAVDLSGIRYRALTAVTAYESARADLVDQTRTRDHAGKTLRWLDSHADAETVSAVAMRLGIPAETLLDVLHDLERVQSGEAAAGGSCVTPGCE